MQQPLAENRRILAVDDDPVILALYRKLFQPEQRVDQGIAEKSQRPPYQLDTFSQGLDAVEAVEHALRDNRPPYTVALIDMRMPPGMDGLETAQRMRAVDRDLLIIFVTAFSDHGTDSISRQLGGDVLWFRKPFEGDELYQTVRSCCVSWNRGHELRLLKQNLDWRVDMQTRRLSEKLQATELLQQNSLSREQAMGRLKQENQSLQAYQDLRLLLSRKVLPQPQPLREGASVRLLLVDDERAVHDLFSETLQQIGFEVICATSVKRGFEEAIKRPPELALIDYQMPVQTGDQMVAMLRGHTATQRTLPLLFTNAGDEDLVMESRAIYWVSKEQPLKQFQQRMALVRDYIIDHRQRAAEGGHLDAETEKQGENHRVLLVDDEQSNLDLLTAILGGGQRQSAVDAELEALMGNVSTADLPTVKGQDHPQQSTRFEVTAVDRGSRAILAVEQAQRREAPYALALIDMRMPPGINGLETARQIRQISPEIEIVIISAYSDYSLQQIQEVLGMNFSFMTKPYIPEVVLQRVVEGCSKWSMTHQTQRNHHALLNLAEDMEQEIVHRREVEQQLEQANRTKDDFLSSMSHELRTPLTTMIGYNEVMAEEPEIPAPYRAMAESSLLAGKMLLQLVNDILDMSKIRSGKFELNEQPFDLRKVVGDVGELMKVFGSQKGVEVELVIDSAVKPHLEHRWVGDEMRLSQILFNLLSNAVKFSDGGGRVTLRLALTAASYALTTAPIPALRSFTLEVVDRGIGMNDETRSRLFTPFEQADSSTARRFGGTGLGLFICKQLVEMMGGEIHVITEEGEGSTFQLILPFKASEIVVEPQEGEQIGVKGGAEIAIPALQGEVLLAEDTIQLQRLATMLIEKSGATVRVANNGLEALEMGQKNHYKLILMDMQMPEMDGIEATRRLREKGITTPIVALTANVMQRHKEMFERAGCDDFLSKPIKRSLLYRLLAQHLDPAGESGVVESAGTLDLTPGVEEDLSDLLDEEMMQEFWDYIKQAKAELQQAWDESNREQLRKTAHAIKGMGSSYGQPKMTEIAAQVQSLAPHGEISALNRAVTALLHELDPVLKKLRKN